MKREENKYNDCISRKAVLELLQNKYIEISITDAGRKEVTIAEINVDKLKALPSVEPQPNIGNWIYGKCNKCGANAPYYPMTTTYYCSDYCPNCGAKMEV